VHALHQRHAEGPAPRQGPRRDDPDRLQGADRRGSAALLRPHPLHRSSRRTTRTSRSLIEEIWDLWCEDGKNRERVGEFIQRIGMGNFLDAIGLDPVAEMVAHPRENPYVFYDLEEDDEDEGDEG
jgi:hypothetical protein